MKIVDSSRTVKLFVVSFLVLGMSLSACRGGKGTDAASTPSQAPATPAPDEPKYDKEIPGSEQTEMPTEPTDTPEPAPATKTPMAADAGVPMAIKAVAKTTSFVAPASLGGIKGNYVTIELTWQPVIGAKEYWIYKTALPTKENAMKPTAYKVVSAQGYLGAYFLDGAVPPSLAKGNIWESVKRGFSGITLKPGQEYKYKVFAVNEDEAVIGESDAATTVPLPPIAAPVNLNFDISSYDSMNKLTTTPSFKWDKSDGLEPDGYYVSVHPPILFGKQAADQQGTFGYAYWSTFRSAATRIARYGSQSDNATSYPGTFPFDITFPLKMNGRYSASVTSVKTDTNDMRTAKAISKSWSDSKIFTVGGGDLAPTNPNGTNPTNTTNSSQEDCNWWCKIKKGASSVVGLIKK
ncbi:MAG: hypothetical protein U0457_09400 [Candidatus Sericytochromatia bacterium]